jgi:hypothetical protein
MALTYKNGAWSTEGLYGAPFMIGTTKAKTTGFVGVSCGSATACTALGMADLGTLNGTGLVDYPFVAAINPVRPLGKPSSPIGVHVITAIGSATVAWLPPYSDGGAKIVQFAVTATSVGLPTRSCLSAGLSCKILSLTHGHAYRVTVTARNALGLSLPSAPITFIAR